MLNFFYLNRKAMTKTDSNRVFQRVGDGVIPIKLVRNLITSELKVQKGVSQVALSVLATLVHRSC